MSVVYVKCKASASLQPNNFTSNDGFISYTHRNEVHVIQNNTQTLTAERAVSRVANYTDKGVVTQARLCRFSFGQALVILTQSGLVNVFDEVGGTLITSYKLPGKTPKESHLRGIASDNDDTLWVGCGTGEILAFKVNPKSTNLTLKDKLEGHSEPVADLAFASDTLISGCEHGDIVLWDSHGKRMKKWEGEGHPVMSVCAGHGYTVAGFSTGHIRMYDLKRCELHVEVSVHTRCVSGVCMHPSKPLVGTCSEDTFVSVWSLPTGSTDGVKNILHTSPSPFLLTGVQFVLGGAMIACTAYDSRYISMLQL